MQKRKGGLGRGLGSLIPQGLPEEETPQTGHDAALPTASITEQPSAGQGVLMVPVERIDPNPRQPRQSIPPEQLEELADSIREHGVLQPLLVTRGERGKYTLVAGERRWRAAERAGLYEVPVLVKEASSKEMLELALVENLQRADLNPLEEAQAYSSLVEEFGLKQEEVATRVGKSRQAVANSLRLLKLPQPVQESLALGLITEGHARALLQVPNQQEQILLMQRIVADGLSVRQAEALARRLAERGTQPDEEPDEHKQADMFDEVRALEDRFRDALGTRVQLSRSSRGGRLVIYFYSDEELDRIYGTIVGEEE